MKRRFESLFTDNPPHEAVTELLDCLHDLAAACDSQHLPRPQHLDYKPREFQDAERLGATSKDR
jgi:hypothetical protein